MKRIGHFILALLIYGLFYGFVIYRAGESLDFPIYIEYFSVIIKGWIITIAISISSLLFSLFVGLILYLMEKSNIRFIQYISQIHKTIIFGVPLLVIVIASYYYIGNAFNIDNHFLIGTITLGFYTGAYIADIYRGAIESVPKDQWQAAKMFGFTKYQTYRYIIFPQVLLSILPPLTGQLALLIKGSALLSYTAFDEFYNVIKTIQASTYAAAEGFIIMAIGYLIITIPLLQGIKILERKVNFRRLS